MDCALASQLRADLHPLAQLARGHQAGQQRRRLDGGEHPGAGGLDLELLLAEQQ